MILYYIALHRAAMHCNALQHSATHCNALHRTAPHCATLHRTAPHCTALHRTAPHCTALHRTATHCKLLALSCCLSVPSSARQGALVLPCVAVCCSALQCVALGRIRTHQGSARKTGLVCSLVSFCKYVSRIVKMSFFGKTRLIFEGVFSATQIRATMLMHVCDLTHACVS